MHVEGILTQETDIVLKRDTVDKLTEKLVKDTNKDIYNRLRIVRACTTRVSNDTIKVKEEISILEDKIELNETEIQKLLLVIASAIEQEAANE